MLNVQTGLMLNPELMLNRKTCCCSASKTRTEVPGKGWHVICIHSNYIIGIVISRIGARPGCAPVIAPVYLLLPGVSTPADTGANPQVTAGLTPLIPSLTQLQIMKLPLITHGYNSMAFRKCCLSRLSPVDDTNINWILKLGVIITIC